MTTPIKPRISGVFVPVRDIEKARDWYNRILGLEGGEILFGHLYCPVMDGPGLMLDAKAATSFDGKDDFPTYRVPAFMFATDDINAAKISVAGDTAVVLFPGADHPVMMVYVKGEWKISVKSLLQDLKISPKTFRQSLAKVAAAANQTAAKIEQGQYATPEDASKNLVEAYKSAFPVPK